LTLVYVFFQAIFLKVWESDEHVLTIAVVETLSAPVSSVLRRWLRGSDASDRFVQSW